MTLNRHFAQAVLLSVLGCISLLIQTGLASSFEDQLEVCKGETPTVRALMEEEKYSQARFESLASCVEVINEEESELKSSGKKYSVDLGTAYEKAGTLNLVLGWDVAGVKCSSDGFNPSVEARSFFVSAAYYLQRAVEEDKAIRASLVGIPADGSSSVHTYSAMAYECIGDYESALTAIDAGLAVETDTVYINGLHYFRRNLEARRQARSK